MKQFIIILLMTSALFLSACSEDSEINYFPSKDEALENLIQSEGIEGNIDLITTTNEEELLVIEHDKNTYSVGELLKDKKGYVAQRISANVVMELGGSWELETKSKRKYTIYFEKEQKDQNYYQLSNEDYYVSLVEGHQINKEDKSFVNSIKDLRVVKD